MSAAGHIILASTIRPMCASRYSWLCEMALGALVAGMCAWGVLGAPVP